MRIRTRFIIAFMIIILLMTITILIVIKQQNIMRSSFFIIEKINKTELLLLECRRQEKNYLLRQDLSSTTLFNTNLAEFIHSTQQLKEEINDIILVNHLNSLEKKTMQYGDLFRRIIKKYKDDYVPDTNDREMDRLIQETVATARECHSIVAEIKEFVFLKIENANAAAQYISITSILLGLLISFIVVYLLCGITVKPLEQLQKLAEKVSTADIQDIDIEFSDMEMKNFNSKETHDLATSIQRMITSLRFLVSSERGLMDDYHMTIVVLVNKAMGPAGWSVIERAHKSAGFSSFSEVNPSNIGEFLSKLQNEGLKLIPNERVHMLITAIQRLNM